MQIRKVIALGVAFFASAAWSQDMSKLDRGRAEDILHVVGNEVRKHYYDPKFHGLDWDATIAEAKQKIGEARSFNGAMSAIAAMLGALDDSHTFFIPPQHAYRHDFGWQYQIIGPHCFVTRMRPKSDAEIKGVKPGDEVLSINGYIPERDDILDDAIRVLCLAAPASVARNPSGFRRQPAANRCRRKSS